MTIYQVAITIANPGRPDIPLKHDIPFSGKKTAIAYARQEIAPDVREIWVDTLKSDGKGGFNAFGVPICIHQNFQAGTI